jgi:hypothetical protein
MADKIILDGTVSLELSAKGSGSDVRSWALGKVGAEGARLFLNNISQPGSVDTIINLRRGNVGIGTASPSTKLTIETGSPGPLVLVRNTSGGNGIRAESTGKGHGLSGASVFHTGTEGASESGDGVHGLSSRGAGVRGESNVGPGVASRVVQGNIFEGFRINNLAFVVRPDGTVLADGPFSGPADFAEMLHASGDASDYEHGDVLVIGEDGKLAKCSRPNSTTLAGVYSTDPGFIGDVRIRQRGSARLDQISSDGELWLPVALLGIVPAKVCDENGPIKPGDLLTSSSRAGHAMRAKPKSVQGIGIYPTGAILGKALEPFRSGTGKIRILVTLR